MKPRIEISPEERARLLLAPTLTLKETADVLGLGLTTLRDGLRRGDLDLPQVRVGTRVLIPSASLLRLLGMDEPTDLLGMDEPSGRPTADCSPFELDS